MSYSFWRRLTQLLVLFGVFYLTFYYLPSPLTIDWLCPFWHLQALVSGNPNSLYLGVSWRPFSISALWLLAFLVLSVLIGGRIFCGWICPFGFLLEVSGKASLFNRWEDWRRKGEKAGESSYLFSFFKFSNYFVLLVFLLLAFVSGKALFCDLCPAGGVLRATVGIYKPLPLFLFGLVFIAVFLLGMKAWCGHLCPLGGFLSFFSRFQVYRIRREGKCAECKSCSLVCPMEVKLDKSFKGKELHSPDCLMCLRCLNACSERILKFPF